MKEGSQCESILMLKNDQEKNDYSCSLVWANRFSSILFHNTCLRCQFILVENLISSLRLKTAWNSPPLWLIGPTSRIRLGRNAFVSGNIIMFFDSFPLQPFLAIAILPGESVEMEAFWHDILHVDIISQTPNNVEQLHLSSECISKKTILSLHSSLAYALTRKTV